MRVCVSDHFPFFIMLPSKVSLSLPFLSQVYRAIALLLFPLYRWLQSLFRIQKPAVALPNPILTVAFHQERRSTLLFSLRPLHVYILTNFERDPRGNHE